MIFIDSYELIPLSMKSGYFRSFFITGICGTKPVLGKSTAKLKVLANLMNMGSRTPFSEKSDY